MIMDDVGEILPDVGDVGGAMGVVILDGVEETINGI